MKGAFVIPFPKPKTKLDKCLTWIKVCGRPHSQFNVDRITKDTYICSKHFKDTGPTSLYPDPVPYDGSATRKARTPSNRPADEHLEELPSKLHSSEAYNVVEDDNTKLTQTEETVYYALDLLAASANAKEMEEEQKQLQQELASVKEELYSLKLKLNRDTVCAATQTVQIDTCNSFCIDNIIESKVKNVFMYYTGFQYATFMILFNFLVSKDDTHPIKYQNMRSDMYQLSVKNQLFLVLCRLRNGFHMKDLAFRFNVSVQCVSMLFNSWIKHMCSKLGYITWWPHRNNVIENMPVMFKNDFPTSITIIDCTEIKTEKPSSLKAQSQCFSDYKSSTTLKSLVCIDPRGSVIFVSSLFTGSISDNDICEKSVFF